MARQHFAAEEQVLAEHDFAELEAHRQDHWRLLSMADQLMAARAGTLGHDELLNFIIHELVVGHMSQADRRYFALFEAGDVRQQALGGSRAGRPRGPGAPPAAPGRPRPADRPGRCTPARATDRGGWRLSGSPASRASSSLSPLEQDQPHGPPAAPAPRPPAETAAGCAAGQPSAISRPTRGSAPCWAMLMMLKMPTAPISSEMMPSPPTASFDDGEYLVEARQHVLLGGEGKVRRRGGRQHLPDLGRDPASARPAP